MVEPMENVTKGANVFHQAGPFRKVEAGVMNSRKEFVPLRGELGVTDARATAEPSAPSIPEAPKTNPAENNVTKLAKAALKLHANELKALGHDGELTIGETNSKSGIETKPDGRIVVDPKKLAADSEGMSNSQTLKRIKRAMAEEVFHAGTIAYANESPENLKRVEALADDAEWVKRGREAYGPEWDNQNRFQKGAEIARMIAQGKEGKLTEAAFRYLKDFLKWLRGKVKNLNPETREVMRGIEEKLGRYEKEMGAAPSGETPKLRIVPHGSRFKIVDAADNQVFVNGINGSLDKAGLIAHHLRVNI